MTVPHVQAPAEQRSTVLLVGEWTGRILQRWRVILAFGALGAATAATIVLLMRPMYVTSMSLIVETSSPMISPGLAELASRFTGTSIGDAGQRTQVYAALLKSRAIQEHVASRRYVDPRTGDSASIVEILDIRAKTPAVAKEVAFRRIDQNAVVSVDNRTGIVTLRVSAPGAELARSLAEEYRVALTEFNFRSRQSQAKARRQFTEERVNEAHRRLREAEEMLRRFHDQNRSWEASPSLRFRESQLAREATLQQELYYSLQRELETARIQEVNDVPTFTVLDEPIVPLRPDRPRRRVAVIAGFLLGIAIAAALTAAQVYFSELRARQPEDMERVTRAWSPLRSLRRARRSAAAL